MNKFRGLHSGSVLHRHREDPNAVKIASVSILGRYSLAEELKPNGPPPSIVQALVGAIMAGAIAYVLYNFTITVESSLDKQFVSSNYSIRQIKITTRKIINDSKPVETENKVNEEAKKGAAVPNPSCGLEGVCGAWCLENPVSPLSHAFPNTATKSSVEG
ncbi:hypothetical protein SUGI_0622130 [Cryptomeria japonica]|nr:hypothetical protein SUGI_0622130 [Cryptomeria japonica]